MIKKPIEEMTREELLRSATYEHAGCTASAMGWAIKYANIHELALRLVQAKGRFHTQKAFEELREFISSENARAVTPGEKGNANE